MLIYYELAFIFNIHYSTTYGHFTPWTSLKHLLCEWKSLRDVKEGYALEWFTTVYLLQECFLYIVNPTNFTQSQNSWLVNMHTVIQKWMAKLQKVDAVNETDIYQSIIFILQKDMNDACIRTKITINRFCTVAKTKSYNCYYLGSGW